MKSFSQADIEQSQPSPKPQITSQTQRRPIASAAERTWRDKNWAKSSEAVKAPQPALTNDEDDTSLALAAELQKFALQQSEELSPKPALGRPRVGGELKGSLPSGRQRNPLKFQPKPPLPRRLYQGQPDAMEIGNESDSEYVYDFYIRVPIPVASPTTTDVTQNSNNAPAVYNDISAKDENIGYLVIRPQDEEAWEEFIFDMQNSSDEEKWEGDSDDSNAEDYYGNDYPDEEDLAREEYGDGSEYGSQDDTWPDEEPSKSCQPRNICDD